MRSEKLEATQAVRERLGRSAWDHWLWFEPEEIDRVTEGVSFGRDPWSGDVTAQEARQKAREGDEAAAIRAEVLLDQMEGWRIETLGRETTYAPAGATPIIPRYLAGDPCSMRTRRPSPTQYAPLFVTYDPTCSAGVSTEVIQRRGTLVCALVMALSRVRPVDLWLVMGMQAFGRDACWLAQRIETRPLDLAHAAHWMSHPGHIRGLMYGTATKRFEFGGQWPYNRHSITTDEERLAGIMRQGFPEASEVFSIPALHLADEMVREPRKWFERTLRRLSATREELV